jgi:hypothetical protein
LVVTQAGDDEVWPGQFKEYIYSGSSWRSAINGGGDSNVTSEERTAIGYKSRGVTAFGCSANASGNLGTAIGYSSVSTGNAAVSLGYLATASTDYSTALGSNATASLDRSTAIGYSSTASGGSSTALGTSSTASTTSSIALGDSSVTQRYAEFARKSSNVENGWHNHVAWSEQTANATKVEIFLYGAASNRCTILANSTISFRINAVARNNVDNASKAWRIEGCIQRDGSNNTALVGSVTTTVIAQTGVYDTTYDTDDWVIDVTADDTNEALKVEVTGEAKTIRWLVNAELSEVRF